MYNCIYEFKTKQKENSLKIRTLKKSRKQDVRKRPLGEIESDIYSFKYKFRHNHIAYCELRGTPYERIENPSSNNPPNRPLIDKIKKEWTKKIEDENVCSMSERSVSESTSSSI